MRLVGVPRSFLLLLPCALACASPSPSGPDPAPKKSDAPAGAPAIEAAVAPTDADDDAEPTAASRRAEPGEHAKMPAQDSAPTPIGGMPPGRLEIAVPSINGGLNRDIIRRIASDHSNDILECHGRALASMPELAGKLVVEVELDADGNVTAAKIGEDSSLRQRDVESCVIALIEGWSFRDAGGKGSASLALEF